MIEAPLRDVAVHVVQAPGVGLLLADLLGRPLGVALEPGVLSQLARIVAEVIGRRRAGPAGPLPLGLGRQTIDLARLLRQPTAILHAAVVGDANHGMAFPAVT